MDIIASLKKVDRIYWVFLAVALIAHTIAAAITFYALNNALAQECNPFQNAILATDNGVITSLIISTAAIFFIILFIPILNHEIEKIGKWTSFTLVFFVGFLTLDAVNDILVIMRHPLSEITVTVLGVPYLIPQYLMNISFRC